MAQPTLTYRITSKDESAQGVRQAEHTLLSLEDSVKKVSNTLKTILLGAEMFAGFKMLGQAIGNVVDVLRTNDKALDQALTGATTALKTLVSDGLKPVTNALTEAANAFSTMVERANLMKQLENYFPGDALSKKIRQVSVEIESIKETLTLAKNPALLPPGMTADQFAKANGIDDLQKKLHLLENTYARLTKQAKDLITIDTPPAGDGKGGKGTVAGVATTLAAAVQAVFSSAETYVRLENGMRLAAEHAARAYADALNHSSAERNYAANYKGTGSEPASYTVSGGLAVKPGDYMADTAPAAGGLDLEAIFGPIKAFASQIASVNALLNYGQTILNAVLAVITPITNTVLQPLVGILVVLGETIGSLLVPVIEALSPVIDFIGKAFIWLYNNVIQPVGNALYATFSWIGQGLRNLGMVIYNIVTGNWGNITAGTTNSTWAQLYASGPLKSIDMSTLMNAGATVTNGSQAAGASYTSARDITVNVGQIQVNTDVITGEGGFRDLVLKIDKELEACVALGLAAA